MGAESLLDGALMRVGALILGRVTVFFFLREMTPLALSLGHGCVVQSWFIQFMFGVACLVEVKGELIRPMFVFIAEVQPHSGKTEFTEQMPVWLVVASLACMYSYAHQLRLWL